MYNDIIFKAFRPTDFGNATIKYKEKKIRGSWIEGMYMEYVNRMLSPVGDSLKPEDTSYVIIAPDGFADWNMPIGIQEYSVLPETACLGSAYFEIEGVNTGCKHRIFANDIIYFNLGRLRIPRIHSEDELIQVKESKTFLYRGIVKYEHNKFIVKGIRLWDDIEFEPVTLEWLMEDANAKTVSVLGSIFDDEIPNDVIGTNIETQTGRILESWWNSERGLTHYITIQLKDGSTKCFGGYSLANEGASIWLNALMRSLGIDRFHENELVGLDVDVMIRGTEPVAIKRAGKYPWMDVRTIF